MNGGAILITICINSLIIYILHVIHKRSIANTIQHLHKEIYELENLVAAIIEEFEEVADGVWQTKPEESNEKPEDNPLVELIEKPIEKSIEAPVITEEEFEEAISSELFQDFSKLKEEGLPETLPMFQPQEIIDPKHQPILQLWKDGLAIEEIAKQLGKGRGEVQLVLGIYRRS